MTNQELIDSGCGCETKIAPASLQCGGSRTTKDQLVKPRLSTIDNCQPLARSSRPVPAQVQRLNSLAGIRPKRTAWLVEVLPDEELPADFCVSLRRILVPTALDEDSAVALDYASALARRFGSELALLYAFEGSDYDQSSCVEAKLCACFSKHSLPGRAGNSKRINSGRPLARVMRLPSQDFFLAIVRPNYSFG